MQYKASLDRLSKGVTIGIIILFIAIGLITVDERGIGILGFSQSDESIVLIHIGIIVFYGALLLLAWLYAIKSYTLNIDDLVINRPIGNKTILMKDVEHARAVDASEMRGTIRTFGNGGLFGYYGRYYNKIIGKMIWYTTQKRNRILITTKDAKKIIITPDDMSLLTELQRKLIPKAVD